MNILNMLKVCLNPCFGGIWSLSWDNTEFLAKEFISLNPCFGGIWSLRMRSSASSVSRRVLILVLVGYGL